MKRLAILALLGFVACAPAWSSLDGLRVAQPPDDVPAIVLLDDTTLRFDITRGEPTLHRHVHVIREIASPSGEGFAFIPIVYNRTYAHISGFRARALSAHGDEKTFTQSDLLDQALPSAGALYTDARILSLQTPYRARGSIVEYEYDSDELLTPASSERQNIESPSPVSHFALTVSAPLGWKIAWSVEKNGQRLDEPPGQSTENGLQIWRWRKNDVPALPKEDAAPDDAVTAAHIHLMLTDWNVGSEAHHADEETRAAWAHDLAAASASSAEIKELANAQTRGAQTQREHAQLLFAWVRDNIAYCAIEIGEGGWRPHAPLAVLSGRYGDCKDKAHLLQTLLADDGIASDVVTINASLNWQPPRRAPSGEFNHAVLYVHLANGDVFADPTSRSVGFGELPLEDQAAPYFLDVPKGGKVQTTEAYPADHNQRELVLQLAPKDGDLVGKAHWTLTGGQAQSARSVLGTSDRAQDDQYLERTALVGMHAKHVTFAPEKTPAAPAPIVIDAQVRAAHAWNHSHTHLLRVSDLLPRVLPTLTAGARTLPVVLPMTQTRDERVALTLPLAAQTQLPPPQHVSSAFGSVDVTYTRDSTALTLERRVRLDTRVVMPEDYAKLVEFIAAATRAEAQPVVVEE